VIPFAAAITTRIPVKLPGPHPIVIKDMFSKVIELSIKKFLIVGIIISDNSFLIGTVSLSINLSFPNKATDKSDKLLSIEINMSYFLKFSKKI
jgi:hypothetical protein